MEHLFIIPISDKTATLEQVGGKGASLNRLAAAGLPVPAGFTITTAAYQQFIFANDLQDGILAALQIIDLGQPSTLELASQSIRERFSQAVVPPEIANAIVEAYANLSGQNPAVAVRSSATAEDLPEASFAGQQETYLNINRPDALLEATRKCWASLWTARAIGYRARQGISPDSVSLAVVVQQLVPAEAAGILFTADPVSGDREHLVISAAWGLGEAVVGGMVTPDNITVDKASQKVIARQTADKQVMTVRVNGGTQEQSVPQSLRQVPVLSDSAALDLTELGVQIEQLYGQPMDIEWALADGQFAIVQARPITALPEPTLPPPEAWILPDPKGMYMRVSIAELMPDPLSPLFETLALPAIGRGMRTLLREMLGLSEETVSVNFITTVNGYAYENAHFTLKEWWLIMTGLIPRAPRMLRVGVSYWQNIAHPRYVESASTWSSKPHNELTPGELWGGVQQIIEAFAIHMAALMGSTMGPSAGSEGLFTQVYERMVMRPGDPPASTFLMGYDSIPIKSDKALYDLAMWCRESASLAAYLNSTPIDQIMASLAGESAPHEVPEQDWQRFQQQLRDYLERYGYSIYNADFAQSLPMDDPAPILEVLTLFITGSSKNPYVRQQAFANQREAAVDAVRARLRGFRRWAFEKSLKWAQSQAPLREDGIAEIGLGYPALRLLLQELGSRFASAGLIETYKDIYWLQVSEIETAIATLESSKTLPSLAAQVNQRQVEWRARKKTTPPPQLPVKAKLLGINMEGMIATRVDQEDTILKGAGASPGKASGIARVLHGPEDFDQMQPGDVLVASITTPAWTPLFTMASAVVTDIGGPLSHGSIVAREYGIPAVLGTGVATKRIHSGQRVSVDGSAGVVSLDGSE